MNRSTNSKRKMKLNVTSTSILLTVGIIIVGGLVLKVIADKRSNARIDF